MRKIIIFSLSIVAVLALAIQYFSNTMNTEKSVTATTAVYSQITTILKHEANDNLTTSISAFLKQWQVDTGNTVSVVTDSPEPNVSGYVVGLADVVLDGNQIYLKMGTNNIYLPATKVSVFSQFSGVSEKLTDTKTSLVIVNLKGGNGVSAEVYNLESSAVEIRESLKEIKGDLISEDDSTAKSTEVEKTYTSLSIDDWRGMTLLTARDLKSKNMAPVVSVPTKDIVSEEYLTGSFYYLIGAVIAGGTESTTQLKVLDGKEITADFGVPSVKQYLGEPAWLHIVTFNSKITSVEVQPFADANPELMFAGMNYYIQNPGS